MEWSAFWKLWVQKIFRNVASMKFQWLLLLYVPTIYGMFEGKWISNIWVAKIPATLGLSFLGGGFVTLALGRIYSQTKLKEDIDPIDKSLDTEK